MKIPFERTIASAYRFAFTNLLSVIGIGWFPFLLVAALAAGLIFLLAPSIHGLWLQDGKTIDTARLARQIVPLIGAGVLIWAALLIAQAMVTVGLMRKALGQHPGLVFVFFSLGSQVWRLIGAYFLSILLILGGMTLIGLAIAAVAAGLDQVAPKAMPFATGFLVFVAVLAYFYSVLRLTFFIPAVVVAENHIGLRRSWHLGRGNFWRIVGILLIVSLPVQMAASTIISTIMQVALVPTGVLTPAPGADIQKVVADMLEMFRRVGPYVAAVEILYITLLSGLMNGAVAAAYMALAGEASAGAKETV